MILHTLTERWYVFVFLLTYLVMAFRTRGLIRTTTLLITGYLIAWLSEASSIRNGFPYGQYYYIAANLKNEVMNWGVPVWDSLSYVFLSFAGWSLSEMIFFNVLDGKNSASYKYLRALEIKRFSLKKIIKIAALSALFTMLLDVVIDPISHLGEKWFLGNIYYYENPGFYFGIPLSNFLGWFLVIFVIVFTNLWIEKKFLPNPSDSKNGNSQKTKSIFTFDLALGGLLYLGIFVFNWIITLYLKEWFLSVLSLVWMTIPAFLYYRSLWQRQFTYYKN